MLLDQHQHPVALAVRRAFCKFRVRRRQRRENEPTWICRRHKLQRRLVIPLRSGNPFGQQKFEVTKDRRNARRPRWVLRIPREPCGCEKIDCARRVNRRRFEYFEVAGHDGIHAMASTGFSLNCTLRSRTRPAGSTLSESICTIRTSKQAESRYGFFSASHTSPTSVI